MYLIMWFKQGAHTITKYMIAPHLFLHPKLIVEGIKHGWYGLLLYLLVPYNMSAHGLPFTDENQPPQYLPSHTPTPNWSNRNPPGLTYYNNITPWNTSAPNSPVDLGLPFTTAGPSHFWQPSWNPHTPSPGQSFQFVAHQPPFSNTTNNSSHRPLNQGSKRTATSQPGSCAKWRQTAVAPAEIETAPICSVGPSRLDSDLPAATS